MRRNMRNSMRWERMLDCLLALPRQVFTFLSLLSSRATRRPVNCYRTYGLLLAHKRYSVHRDNYFFRACIDQQRLTHSGPGASAYGCSECHRDQHPLLARVAIANCNESQSTDVSRLCIGS
jgi:hypothetical protein